MKTRVSIVMATHNGLEHTAKCLQSVFEHTKDFELIVVDNGSTDGTVGYLKELMEKMGDVKAIFNDGNRSFAEANNQGIREAGGDYVCLLNNDTVVTPEWMERMILHLKNIPLGNVGIVGPVSSMSNGKQMVGAQDPQRWFEEHKGHWVHVGVIYGWCMLIKREVIDAIGLLDERFTNSYEDNDLCLRAQLAGYKLAIAYDTYIHHLGQGTIRKLYSLKDYSDNGEVNRVRFYEKHRENREKKLVAVYRTNGGFWLEESLRQTSKFADAIVIHFCRAPKYKTMTRDQWVASLRKMFPKIVHVEFYDGIFQEDYERGRLLQIALEMHARDDADWCISVDDDEMYEDEFVSRVRELMSPRNPEIFGYWCQWRTIWEKRLGVEYYRMDSTFGRFSNYRLFRLFKGQEILSDHPEGHHCGSAPILAPENLCWTKMRVKHMGYDTPEQRQKKHEFYEANDHFKTKRDIGNDDYSHLVDLNVQLQKYSPSNRVSLIMMVRDEEEYLRGCLEHIEPLVDEYVIVDTGSVDGTKKIIEDFKKHCQVPVKVFDFPWPDNYSIPRNFAKAQATGEWILMMDADERFAVHQLNKIFQTTETDADYAIFQVLNYLEHRTLANPQPKYTVSEATRLFRNIPEFYYTGILHETLDDSFAVARFRRRLKFERSEVILHHHGYLKEKKRVNEKLDYYAGLNERQIEVTERRDPRPYFNLALHLMNEDKHEEAIGSFQKALKIRPLFWHANQQMAAINMKSAKAFLQRTLMGMPPNHPFRGQAQEILDFLDKKTFGYQKVGV